MVFVVILCFLSLWIWGIIRWFKSSIKEAKEENDKTI